MAKGPVWTSQEKEQLFRLVANGSTDAQISAIMHRPETSIRCQRSRFGLVTERRERWSDEEKGVLCRAYDAGYSVQQIAEMLNRPAVSVESKLYKVTDYSRFGRRTLAADSNSAKVSKSTQHLSDDARILSLQARLEAVEKYLARGCLKRIKGFKPDDRL